MKKNNILLVNPWIEDFSAFDQWIKPIPLLKLSSWLKSSGFNVYLIDMLDRDFWQGKNKKYNTGKFKTIDIEKPQVFDFIDRKYRRFGGNKEEFKKKLLEIDDVPQWVFTGLPITYWYQSLWDIIDVVHEVFPDTKIAVGGNYAKLLSFHLKNNRKVEYIFSSSSYYQLEKELSLFLGFQSSGSLWDSFLDISYYKNIKGLPILTVQGCPYHCTYCAVPKLYEKNYFRSPDSVIREIEFYIKKGVEDIAFFDDALLVNREKHVKVILRNIIKLNSNIRFHLPNAVHSRLIDTETAQLMKNANFKTIRLGLESIDPDYQKLTGEKVLFDEFKRAVNNLFQAGFESRDIGAYVMYGSPADKVKSVQNSITTVQKTGIKSMLVTYSPVPGTADFEKYSEVYPEIRNEPLLHNKVVSMYRNYEEYKYLKEINDDGNKLL